MIWLEAEERPAARRLLNPKRGAFVEASHALSASSDGSVGGAGILSAGLPAQRVGSVGVAFPFMLMECIEHGLVDAFAGTRQRF